MVEKFYSSEKAFEAPPVIEQGEFDTFLLENPLLWSFIAGFSTISWEHLLSGSSPEGLSVKQWGLSRPEHVNMDLIGQAQKVLRRPRIQDPNYAIMIQNREHGEYWSAGSVLLEMGIASNIKDADELFNEQDFSYLVLKYKQEAFKSQQTFSDWEKESYQSLINDVFEGNESTFFEFLKKLKERRPVQVIYGTPEKFISYAEQFQVKSLDDYAIRLHADIPPQLILALVKLL